MRYGGLEMRGFLLGAIASGCCAGGASPVLPPIGPAPVPRTDPTPVSAPSARAPGPTRTLQVIPLEPAPAGGGPTVQILRPRADEQVPGSAAKRFSVEVRIEHGDREHPVLLALDGGRPRVLEASGTLPLSDLLSPDLSFPVGPHRLLAVATDASGLALRAAPESFSSVSFFVGDADRGAASTPPSELFCLSPVGTHYGTDAKELILDVFPVSPLKMPLTLFIEGPEVQQTLFFDPDHAYRVAGLSGGDHRFRVQGAGRVLCECVTTLNPELLPESPR